MNEKEKSNINIDKICDTISLEELDALRTVIMYRQKRQDLLSKHDHAIYQGKDGRWRTKIRTADGNIKTIRKTNKEDIEDAVIAIIETNIRHKTVRDIYLSLAEERRRFGEITEQSLTKYKNDFERFFPEDDEFCKIDMLDITESDIEQYVKRAITTLGLEKKAYSALRTMLRKIFRYAKREKLTDLSISSILGDLMLPDSIFSKREKTDEALEVFSETEEKKVISYVNENPDIRRLGVKLAFETGVRVGELTALKWSDVDLKNSYFTVNRTEISYDDENGKRIFTVSEDTAKTEAGERTVYLPVSAVKTLKEIRALNPFGEWVFAYDDGHRIKSKSINRCLQCICRAIGIPVRSSHKIRKTYASALIAGGASEKLIQRQLGHADISTTHKYYNRDRQTAKEKVSELNRIIG